MPWLSQSLLQIDPQPLLLFIFDVANAALLRQTMILASEARQGLEAVPFARRLPGSAVTATAGHDDDRAWDMPS
jgi:hypothetical protein